ncbi:hypothetical protein JW848_03440 [Candidatus Bipolaricaulota bacterium]|nr:hypothetical protein [Candidatus Bipolaricaulota bacterium]
MIRKFLGGLFVLLLAGMLTLPALGAADEEIQAAIDAGVQWLVAEQDINGEWPYYGELGPTGFGVLKLEDYAFESGTDPFDPAYEYYDEVRLGFGYIFDQAQTDSDGVFFRRSGGGHETYSTGIVMMTIAASQDPDHVVDSGPLAGWTYLDVVQGCVDWFAANQNGDGGWKYNPPPGEEASDQSNTGYAVLGLRYAQEFGCSIPASILAGLENWVTNIQDPVDGDTNDGGSWYMIDWSWVNLLKTGNLLFEMALLGDTVTAPRVHDALDYIARHWDDANWDPGWQGTGVPPMDHPDYQTMYCLMKGFAALGIPMINVGGIERDWFDEFTDAIIASQNADGSWPPDGWGNSLLTTQWALLVLEYVVPPYEILIDIKPGSFPNSINPGQNGTIPVALLSTPEFDATTVEPDSLTFGRTGGEDSLAYRGKKNPRPQVGYEDVNGDGLLDLVAHFVAETCGFLAGDELGHLRGETFDGLSIFGSDSVRTVPPNETTAIDALPMEIAAGLSVSVVPSPIRDVHTAYFEVVGPMAAQIGQSRVKVFDLSGALIWEQISAGSEIAWHTEDLYGRFLANGVYIYQVLVEVEGRWISVAVDKIAILR